MENELSRDVHCTELRSTDAYNEKKDNSALLSLCLNRVECTIARRYHRPSP